MVTDRISESIEKQGPRPLLLTNPAVLDALRLKDNKSGGAPASETVARAFIAPSHSRLSYAVSWDFR